MFNYAFNYHVNPEKDTTRSSGIFCGAGSYLRLFSSLPFGAKLIRRAKGRKSIKPRQLYVRDTFDASGFALSFDREFHGVPKTIPLRSSIQRALLA